MPSHSDASIGYEVRSGSLEEQMQLLEQTLIATLRSDFQALLGIPIPDADKAELLELGTAMKYQQKLSVGEFLSGARRLVRNVFDGHEELIAKALLVADAALKNIFAEAGSVQLGFQGDSARISYSDETYVAACYTSTSFCSKSLWATQSDFYVSKFVYTVFKTDRHRSLTLAALRTI